jgi:plastocyanin
MVMNRIALIGMGILLATSSLVACSDSNDKSGTGGSGGTGHAGSGGSTGAAGSAAGGTGGGAGGGASSFASVQPCASESDYTAGTTISFSTGFVYTPKCLKVTAGTSVTFEGAFGSHPLSPSQSRGNTTDNPIEVTNTGTSKSFTFDKPGVYAYFCEFHGSGDDGSGMAGAIWVQ